MAKLNLYAYIIAKHAMPDDNIEYLFKILTLERNTAPDTGLSNEILMSDINNDIFETAIKLYKININIYPLIESYEDVIKRVFLKN